jgi:hypothetical protein
MQGRRIGGAAALALALGLAACDSTRETEQENPGTAQVRLMNVAAGSPALDLVVGGEVVASSVGFEQSSPLEDLPEGNQTLVVRAAGTQVALASRQVTIQANAKYALVVGGTLAALTLTNSIVSDTGLASPNRANIRIINVSGVEAPTDSSQAPPPVFTDVYVTAPGANLSASQTSMSLDARYPSYSTLLYFDPGTHVVTFTVAGSTQVRAATGPITISAGQIRAVTLQKMANGTYQTSVVAEQP